MSVLIKGTKMPKGCRQCHFKEWTNSRAGWFCPLRHKFLSRRVIIQDKRYVDCPLIEIPPHGDLIDKDKLVNVLFDLLDDSDKPVHDMLLEVETAPTVIESEEQEHDNTTKA